MTSIKTEINGLEVALTDLIEVMGHDDSLPYNAHLVINGFVVANVYNDGWGGTTNIEMIGEIDVSEALICSLINAIKPYKVPYSYGGVVRTFDFTLDYMLDCMAYDAIDCGYSHFSIEDACK